GGEGVGGLVAGKAEPAAGVGGFAIGIAAAVRDPDAAARAHHRIHRRYQTARRRLGLDLSVFPNVAHRLAVGDDYEQPSVELEVDELLETLLGPHALSGQPHPALLL